MSDNYTIEEVCSMINQYIEERTHYIDGEPIRGTASRIAAVKVSDDLNKGAERDANISKNNTSNKFVKNIKRNANVTKTIKQIQQHADDAAKLNTGSTGRLGAALTNKLKNDFIKSNEKNRQAVLKSVGDDKEAISKINEEANRHGYKVTNDFNKDIDKYNKKGDKEVEKLRKIKRKYIPESYNDVINTKLAIYESCDAGYITEDEKLELLTILEASTTQKNKGIEFIALPQKANGLHDKLISEFGDNDDIYSIYTKSAIETRHKNYDVVDTSKDSYVLIVYSDNRVKNIIMKFLRDNRITKYSEITGYNEKNIWTKWKDKYNLKFGED